MGRRSGPPGPPSRNFGYSLRWLRTSPGARKERIRRGQGRQPVDEPEGERWPGSPGERNRAPAPAIDFDSLSGGYPSSYQSPGARKERLRRRPARRRPPAGPVPELHAASAFSFAKSFSSCWAARFSKRVPRQRDRRSTAFA